MSSTQGKGISSDAESSEPPVREKLRMASIAGLPDNTASTASVAPIRAVLASVNTNLGDGIAPAELSERGRLLRKRSFEEVEEQPQDSEPAAASQRHARKRSRDTTTEEDAETLSPRKVLDGGSESESESESEDKEAPNPANILSNGIDRSEASAIPELGLHGQTSRDRVMSPKGKRSREAYAEDEEVVAATLLDHGSDKRQSDDQAVAEPATATGQDVSGGEPKSKRHRDSSSPQPAEVGEKAQAVADDANTKPSSTQEPVKATQTSSAAPPDNITPSAPPLQTSADAFAASGFGRAAKSGTSAFSAFSAGKPAGGLFAGLGASEKPAASSFGAPKSNTGFGSSLSAENKPPSSGLGGGSFGAAAPSPFGKVGGSSLSGGFGTGFGSGFGGSLGGFNAGGLKPFTGSGMSGLGVPIGKKDVRPFGAPPDEEQEGSENEDDSAGLASPKHGDDPKDNRFRPVDIETGEENETIEYTCRAKLYNFVPSSSDPTKKEWKERGLGVLRLNVENLDDTDGDGRVKARFVMRADGSHKVVLNTPIKKELKFGNPKGEEPVGGYVYFMGSVGAGLELLQLKMRQQFAADLCQRVWDLQKEM
ncbi:hypothetical protein LTR66_008666 [Elasticomyces elasticus]|nr:hypothetical protein LTR66_008666 [Elasticomyces elasticus]